MPIKNGLKDSFRVIRDSEIEKDQGFGDKPPLSSSCANCSVLFRRWDVALARSILLRRRSEWTS
jgi:hypothetical protein